MGLAGVEFNSEMMEAWRRFQERGEDRSSKDILLSGWEVGIGIAVSIDFPNALDRGVGVLRVVVGLRFSTLGETNLTCREKLLNVLPKSSDFREKLCEVSQNSWRLGERFSVIGEKLLNVLLKHLAVGVNLCDASQLKGKLGVGKVIAGHRFSTLGETNLTYRANLLNI